MRRIGALTNRKDQKDEDASSEQGSRPRGDAPARERRSQHRVAENQGSGQGALTALSKLRMLERRRDSVTPRGDSE
jgi:hypothetical protein